MSGAVIYLPESVNSIINEFGIGTWSNLYELLGKIEYLKLTKYRFYFPSSWEFDDDRVIRENHNRQSKIMRQRIKRAKQDLLNLMSQ